MGLISAIKNMGGKVTTFLSAVPGLKRLKGAGRIIGLLGVLMQIGASVIQSISSLNPLIFFKTFGMNLVIVDQGLAKDVTALKAGATGMQFWWHTWGIYSKLWFILFVTGLIAAYLRRVHLGRDIPKYQLYLVTFIFIITPIQMIGAVIVNVFQSGVLKQEEIWQVINFWEGIRMVGTNANVWIEPAIRITEAAPGIEPPTGSNQSLNETAQGIQTINT